MPARRPRPHIGYIGHDYRTRLRPRPRNRVRRAVLRTAAALAVLVLAAGGAGYAMVSSAERELRRVDPFSDLPDNARPADGGGDDLNILLIGTDSRSGLTAQQRKQYHLGGAPCHCADTIMLLHLSGNRDRASVVSLPRDSYAKLPAHTYAPTGDRHGAHVDKLNAALSHGGPSLMVRAVEKMTELRVDHYLEVDFTSFMSAVDEVGGVEVCTTRRLRDDYSGLDLPAGSHTLDGATALAYVRARHVDVTSDFGRMERQQRFLSAFLDQAISSGVLLNPARLSGTASALLRSVRADPDFGVEEMFDLARAMRGFKASDAEFTSVPIGDPDRTVPNIGSTVTWDREQAASLFDDLREDRSIATEEPKPREGGGAADSSGSPESSGSSGSSGRSADAVRCGEP